LYAGYTSNKEKINVQLERESIKVILADDHGMFRKAIMLLLSDSLPIEVVGEASNGQEVLDLLVAKKPSMVLMDLDMPVMDGSEATLLVKKRFPEVKIIVLTMHREPEFVEKMIRIGASGFLTKNSSKEELLAAVSIVHNGGQYICADAGGSLSAIRSDVANKNLLSEREIEIIRLISDGYKTKDISDRLSISIKTVEAHRSNIFKKLQVKNVAAMLRSARQKTII
jgi:DNA-binding NarL/FixJ family response regulator